MNLDDLEAAVIDAIRDVCPDGGRIATPEDGLEILATVARVVYNFDYYLDGTR